MNTFESVEKAMKTYHNQQLFQKMTNPTTIPPFPDVALRTMKLLQNPNCSFREIYECLILDPSLVALVLKVVNSPLFPIQREITNINMALSYLGFKRLRSLLYTFYFRTLMEKGASRFEGQDKFWSHSLSTGIYAQIIGIQCDYPDDSECFTAGLIHDIGRLVIGIQDPARYREIIDVSTKQDIPMVEAEQRILGFDHQDVGYSIGKKWNFPTVIVEAISHHHELVEFDRLPDQTKIVALGNVLSHAEEEGEDSPSLRKAVPFLEKLGLDSVTQEGIRVLYKEKFMSVRAMF